MTQSVTAALAAFAPGLPLAVCVSGGADSTALLLACARRWPGRVYAIHVHHGLQSAADAFEAHCVALCARLGVPLVVRRIDARAAPGQSPEDAARQARYEVFRSVPSAEWSHLALKDIAIAHHADDQAETVLIALSRGAGLPGLAAMPAYAERAGLRWHRPLLGVRADAIRDWLRAQGETWVEDPSNADPRFTRNRLRTRVLPVLEAALPQFRETFARSARHAAQAQQLLDELAALDLAVVGQPPSIAALRTLTAARQANVLRHWLRRHHATTPTEAQLAELLRQIDHCRTRGHRLHLRVGSGFVRREGAGLVWSAA
ncbi:MAG: tRNA lysidine(34) synthetase TilS [Tibeticola sp.]